MWLLTVGVAIWVLEYCYVVAKVFWWLLTGPRVKLICVVAKVWWFVGCCYVVT